MVGFVEWLITEYSRPAIARRPCPGLMKAGQVPAVTIAFSSHSLTMLGSTLIQNRSRVRNVDLNSSLFGFDCCALAAS